MPPNANPGLSMDNFGIVRAPINLDTGTMAALQTLEQISRDLELQP
jgi:hypothetical protein